MRSAAMCRRLRGFLSFRPHVLTLIALSFAAALIALANLSDDLGLRRPATLETTHELTFDVQDVGAWHPYRGYYWNLSYGWPLLWRQYVGAYTGGPMVAFGKYHSAARLAVNLTIWIALLALIALVCEWLLRRYRPRFRWSLRTMLLGVAILAAALGWYVSARNRADRDDALVAMLQDTGEVWFERWGPKWLDVIGADRLRRRVIGAKVDFWGGDPESRGLELLRRLQEMPQMQYLFIDSFDFTPELARALGGFSRLRILSIDGQYFDSEPGTAEALADALGRMRQLRELMLEGFDDGEEPITRQCLAALRKLPQLEYLYLFNADLDSESLAGLAQVPKLKTLRLSCVRRDERSLGQPLLVRLPVLPELRSLDLEGYSNIGDDDLDYLTRLPNLNSLCLDSTKVTTAGLAKLAALPSLEELTLGGDALSGAGLEKLLVLKHLRALHFNTNHRSTTAGEPVPFVEEEELEPCLNALRALRQARPGIVIDGDYRRDEPSVPDEYESSDHRNSTLYGAREAARQWEEVRPPAVPLPVPPPPAGGQ